MKLFDNEDKNQVKISNPYKLLACFILAIGSILRIWGFWDWSLSNDELSTLVRSSFPTYSEVISKGVIPDNHPVFVESFMHFWMRLFGNSIISFRLPAVLASIIGLVFMYKLAKRWFNEKAAILAISIVSTSYLFVLYSQITRAYSFGLMFAMGFAYYSLKVTQDKVSLKKDKIALVIFGILGAVTHYFTTLTIFISALVFMLISLKKSRKTYFILCIIIVVLFIPHIPITLTHISKGGLGWISAPEPKFIFDFLNYVFNQSTIWQTAICFIPIISFSTYKYKNIYKKQLATIAIFGLTYSIAYFYSVYRMPVIQFNTLIFCTPFLIIFISSFVNNNINPKVFHLILSIVTAIGIYTLIVKNEFYKTKYFADFEAVSQTILNWKAKYNNQMISISNANNSAYFDYYLKDQRPKVNFKISEFKSHQEIAKARDIIAETQKQYISISFGNVPVPKEVHEFAKLIFSEVVERKRFFNSEAVLYKKSQTVRKKTFYSNALDTANKKWEVDLNKLNDSIYYQHPPAFQLNSDQLYSLTFRSKVGKLSSEKNRWLTLELFFKSQDTCNLTVVVDVKRNGESIFWRGDETKAFYKKGEWSHFITVWERPAFVRDDDDISIFIWNLNQTDCMVDDFSISNFADSDYNYY